MASLCFARFGRRWSVLAPLGLVLGLLWAAPVAAQSSPAPAKRVALVIGNGNYQAEGVPKLPNPAHDAEDIASALRGFGFEVIERQHVTLRDMNAALEEFSRKLRPGDAALFYYAGHGLQVKGQNYLVPVDAKLATEASVAYEAVSVNRVLDELDAAQTSANIVMLDACRNNPISGQFRSGAARGLAPAASSPKGTVIVYATDPGNVAADGEGRNGLFTASLLSAFKGGDLSLHGVLVRASKEVERASKHSQSPYINGPAVLQEEFQFAPRSAAARSGQLAEREPLQLEPAKCQQEEAAARRGAAAAQAYLGLCYEKGIGFARNTGEAANWYRRAAEQGLATAQYKLGSLYANGEGVARSEAEAVKWYRAAAAQGAGSAQMELYLALHYAKGQGVPRDAQQALAWYRKAAERGNADAQNMLGWFYYSGQGVPKDRIEAMKWYQRAADQGHAEAQAAIKKILK